MHKSALTIFFLFGFISSIGQDFRKQKLTLFKAEQIYRSNENLDQAVLLYKEAFGTRVNDASIALDALYCAAKARNEAMVVFFMEEGMLSGLEVSDYRRHWNRITTTVNFEEIISKCDTLTNRNIYRSTLNLDLIDSLRVLAQRDQEYRGEESENDALQKQNDRQNWRDLKNIVQRMGRLPKYSEIGLDGSGDLDILFYHMDKEPMEWFLPFIIQNIKEGESNLSEIILYQIDRIGMADGLIYTITDDLIFKKIDTRTKMRNGYYCQAFGEWFKEKSRMDGKLYFVPIDPNLSLEEVNRVRALFYLDTIESLWNRHPWAKVVSIHEFEDKIQE